MKMARVNSVCTRIGSLISLLIILVYQFLSVLWYLYALRFLFQEPANDFELVLHVIGVYHLAMIAVTSNLVGLVGCISGIYGVFWDKPKRINEILYYLYVYVIFSCVTVALWIFAPSTYHQVAKWIFIPSPISEFVMPTPFIDGEFPLLVILQPLFAIALIGCFVVILKSCRDGMKFEDDSLNEDDGHVQFQPLAMKFYEFSHL